MKWDYAILATGKTHFSNVETNRIYNKIAFGTNLKVETKCRLTSMTYGSETRPLLVYVGLKFERAEMQMIRWMLHLL